MKKLKGAELMALVGLVLLMTSFSTVALIFLLAKMWFLGFMSLLLNVLPAWLLTIIFRKRKEPAPPEIA